MADKEAKSDQIGVRITAVTRERLEKVAKQEDRSISFIVNRLIEKYLDNEFPQKS